LGQWKNKMNIVTVLILIILFLLVLIVIAYIIGYKNGAFKRDKFWEEKLPAHRKEAILKSRAVLTGQFTEQLAPYLPDFPFLPTECRFIGKPIDFLVFKGMDDKDVNEIVFVEVKSGNSKLNSTEKEIKRAVEDKRVRWEEYRIPEDLSKKKEGKDLDNLEFEG
jgi:predicted Holliday junction resolvase-like endonuclease